MVGLPGTKWWVRWYEVVALWYEVNGYEVKIVQSGLLPSPRAVDYMARPDYNLSPEYYTILSAFLAVFLLYF